MKHFLVVGWVKRFMPVYTELQAEDHDAAVATVRNNLMQAPQTLDEDIVVNRVICLEDATPVEPSPDVEVITHDQELAPTDIVING